MIKRLSFFISIWMFVATTAQAFTPLIDSQDFHDLPTVKRLIKNVQTEDIVFNAFVDASKQTTHQRRGILIRRENPIGTVVICHGYLGCKRDSLALKHLFPKYLKLMLMK